LAAENPKSLLLRLPYDIRRRIYEYAGLDDGLFVSLNYEFPPSINRRLQASDSSNELTRPEGYVYQEENDYEYEKQDEDEGEHEYEDEVLEYSQSVARFLDGPILDLDNQLKRREPRCCENYGDDCDCEPEFPLLPSQLLDVCRQLSNEVEHIFYSKSHFNTCRLGEGGHSGLLLLKPKALSWLSSLSIDLYICKCRLDPTASRSRGCIFHSGACYRKYPDLNIPGHEKLLRTAAVRHKSREMTEWKQLCRHLAAFIIPRQLTLWVRVDVTDVEKAKEITLPMMQLPVLRACTIQFYWEPCMDELEDLARNTVLKLTGRLSDTVDSPFRFLDLPREIQLHILQYTDLVSNKDISWCPEPDFDGPRVFEASSLVWDDCDTFTDHFPYEFKCCGKCSDVRESCCCFLTSTSFSSTCTCWRMPTPIFSVSRRMREDTTAIFFSRNHFLILPPREESPFFIKQNEPLEILRFFSRFAARGKKYLRSVTWMLPEVAHVYWGPREQGEWERVVDICAEELSIQGLTFTIDMSYQARRCRAVDLDYSDYRVLPISDSEECEWDTGLFMMKSMGRYKGWKNVYVHLSWPWYNRFNNHDPYTCSEEAQELRHHQEAVLEQQVMWPGSAGDGKYDRRHAWNGYNCGCEDYGNEDW
jgi:hypothetical protein